MDMTNEQLTEENKKLKQYILNLEPYCNNCTYENNEDNCDECHRKYFNWKHKVTIKLPS